MLHFFSWLIMQSNPLRSSKKRHEAFRHAIAASAGEVTACLVRVPVEIIKQRRQAFQNVEPSLSSTSIVKKILHSKGFLGLYRGYFTTVSREVPFSIIQFPLWEYFKHKYALNFNAEASPGVSASFGAVSGGIAAGLTTPLDVAKTRIMLSDDPSTKRTLVVLRDIFVVNGFRGLFAGIVPRTMWMSIGGFIFFGAYEGVKDVLIRK
uniref:S-adenosylmethionine mitochondrial carrier protein n=1 Tax=Lepeophtheirus salmonis TaxID=72036 RepID=D3PIP4_LEPSM|nr:S-adenosylmethionine mitochondrial carrier protein [Lepeophtheirus salmonis]